MTSLEAAPLAMAPLPRRLSSYTARELREIAVRCEERQPGGFIVTPESVQLFAAGLRALARERARRKA